MFICGIGNRIENIVTFALPIEYWHNIEIQEVDKEPYNDYKKTRDFERLTSL